MRMDLRSTVAIAALALATPSLAQAPAAGPGQGRPQERPPIERPGDAGGAERGLERAQERQERAQERQLERQKERSAQPARSNDDRPDAARPPRSAEPARPATPASPERRDAESNRPDQEGRGNEKRPDSPRNPRAAEPATPTTPSPTQREAQPSRSTTPPQPDSTATRTPTTPDQQRAINETIERQVERRAVRPTRDIGVSISVGASLPERVRIERLPREIVDLRPQYRDYGVVVTERETVIVDPRTRRVVEVIGRPGGREADSMLVERIERGGIRQWRNPRVEIREDVILPADAPLVDLPDEYVERTPRYRGYRYVASGDEIAIVEPRSRRVVQVIDRKQARSAQNGDRSMITGSISRDGLSRDEREEINRQLLQRATPGSVHGMRDLRGSTLPSSIELQRLPSAIAERSPSLKDMSYVLIGDDALIVEPQSRRVVDVIE